LSKIDRPVRQVGMAAYTPVADERGGPEPAFRSSRFLRAMAQAERFARDRSAPILIEGESGTGKTQLARHIHRHSPRAAASFRAVVMSTLDDSLASSELFGHVAGAYTDARSARAGHFATAHGGTLFLDEIGKCSQSVQQKLLHAVEYGEIRPVGSDREVRVDARVICATNGSLEQMTAGGHFLPDLYARLSSFRVRLPPLRERRADIPIVVEFCVTRWARECGYPRAPAVDIALMSALQDAPWPNNLRQLDATIHRLLVDAEGADRLTLDHCLDDLAYLRQEEKPIAGDLTPARVSAAIERAGSISGAAKLLGVDRTTIHRFQRRSQPGD